MSDNMAKQIQLILLQYGVISYLRKKKTHINSFINRVTITNRQNIADFDNFVKHLPCKKKHERLKLLIESINIIQKVKRKFLVKKLENLDTKEEIIYDIFVEDNNNFFLNGILTHNSGKSYSTMTLAILHSALNGRIFNINYVCGNIQEYIEKLRTMQESDLLNSFFQIDESKKSIYGSGSFAKKTKTEDIANIIALNNISTAMLCPTSWSDEKAMYGLRAWGKCKITNSARFMLYNLQEGGKGGTLPLGCVYIPIFTEFAPKPYSTDLEKQYMEKKRELVRCEMRGEGDILAEIKKNSARTFLQDKQFMALTKKAELKTFISAKLGSEWTKGECEEIYQLTEMMKRGITFDK
jgi:hypothetical protein